MDDRIQEFVADDAWLFVAIVTLGLTSLAGVAGLEALAGAITIVGWFLLTPILLFWGEEVALLLGGEDDAVTAPVSNRETEPGVDADPLEELKRRYAAGEIDDAEFERRLERLVAVDELPEDAFTTGSSDGTTGPDAGSGTDSLERDADRNRERDRER